MKVIHCSLYDFWLSAYMAFSFNAWTYLGAPHTINQPQVNVYLGPTTVKKPAAPCCMES